MVDRREERRWNKTDLSFIKGRPKAYVCFGGNFGLITSFLAEIGFTKAKNVKEADLIVYGGGADVNPELYGQKPISRCGTPDTLRDRTEKNIFEEAKKLGIPQIGICRGAQFLHVMNGGELWQHVNNHAGCPHMMYDMLNDYYVKTSSTHHQMMKWNEEMNLLACCATELATHFEDANTVINLDRVKDNTDCPIEVEVCSYPETSALCIQGHPEYGPLPFTTWSSMLIEQWFNAVTTENNNLEGVF